MQVLARETELVQGNLKSPLFLMGTESRGQESGLEWLSEKLSVYYAGDGNNGKFGAEEGGDLTQLLSGSL